MRTPLTVPSRVKASGILLIIIVGLLNFHIPHFLFQSPNLSGSASHLLELVLFINVLAAMAAAIGIWRSLRLAWQLGLVVAGVSALLYVAQETVGLPGLPRAWLEPSRIVALLVEALYVILAGYQLVFRPSPSSASGG